MTEVRNIPTGYRLYLSLLAAIALLCAVAICVWLAQRPVTEPTQPTYLLKDNAGQLALYTGEGEGPLAEYDIYTRLLPEQDLLALQQGVPVTDEADLQRKLEDYGL